MNNLWAPWRMDYVEREPPKGCIFCRYPAEESDRENLLLWRGERVFVMLNRYPYSNGHLLVVPYLHTADLGALAPEDRDDLFRTVTRMTAILGKVVKAEGFNVGMNLGRCAGAGIADHLHAHVVPRWTGDTNFMAVLGEVKVIAEHLSATYDKLAEAL